MNLRLIPCLALLATAMATNQVIPRVYGQTPTHKTHTRLTMPAEPTVLADQVESNQNAVRLLQQTYDTYSALHTFSCEMQSEVSTQLRDGNGKPLKALVQVYTTQYDIIKPDRLRYTLTNDQGLVDSTVSDGKFVSLETTDPGALPLHYIKKPLGRGNILSDMLSAKYLTSLRPQFSTLRFMPEVVFGVDFMLARSNYWRLKGTTTLNGESVDIVGYSLDFPKHTDLGPPSTSQSQYETNQTLLLYIAQRDHLLREVSDIRTSSDGTHDSETEIYQDVHADPELAPEKFTFRPSSGLISVDSPAALYPPRKLSIATAEAVKVGAVPTSFAVNDLQGRPVTLADFKGRVVLLDFWATWCPPCRREVPAIVAANQKFHGRGLEVVGFAVEKDAKKVTDFTRENKMPWPEVLNYPEANHDVANNGYIPDSVGIPYAVLIGRDGKVAAVGLRDAATLEAAIEAALSK